MENEIKIRETTLKAIEVLLLLFTEEQLEQLSIKQGRTSVTLKEQFMARWANARPIYPPTVFKAKAAQIINANRVEWDILCTVNTPEFIEQMRKELLTPEAFKNTQKTKVDGTDKRKTLGLNQSTGKSLSRAHSKGRGGTSESGQEYIELDKVWDKEDMEFLNAGMPTDALKGVIKVAEQGEGLGRLSIALETQQKQTSEQFAAVESGIELETDEPTLQSVTTQQNRAKTMGETTGSSLGFNDQEAKKDMTTTLTKYTQFQAYQQMMAARVQDMREKLFMRLDYLFHSCL